MITIGSHLIVKGEAHNIASCLNSCRGLVDFTVVAVDSRPESDETFELIKDLENVYAYRQEWKNSFAEARNDALNKLVKLRPDVNYILWIDGDDQWGTVKQGSVSHEEIRIRLEDLRPEAVNNTYIYADDLGSDNPNLSYQRLRIFSHEPGKPLEYDWEGSAHETLMCRSSSGRPTLSWDDWILIHYRAPDIDFKTKTARNIEMLELDLEKNPNNTRTMFYLGREYKDYRDYEKSIVMMTKYVHKSNFKLEKYQALLDLGYMYLWRNDLDSAREKTQDAIRECPEIAFAYTLLGEISMKCDRPDLARIYFAQAVFAPHGSVLFDYIPGRTYIPYRWLSVACNYSGMSDEAVYYHALAKKIAPQDGGIKYNDPWLNDNSREFPIELTFLSSFDNSFNNKLTTASEFLRESLTDQKLVIDSFDESESFIISKESSTLLINKIPSEEGLEELIKTTLADKNPLAILVKDFGDWSVKSIIARYIAKTPEVSLYRNYEISKVNPSIDRKEGLGILIRTN